MSLLNRSAMKKEILKLIAARGNPIITDAYERISSKALDDYEYELVRMMKADVKELRADGSKTFRRAHQ